MNYPLNKALFLDRDGVINIDHGHVHRVENFDFIDGIFDLCRLAQQKGFLIIVITNQAGIGKGLYTEEVFHKLNSWMIDQFEQNEIKISKTYYCPHNPENNCFCRKPKPGLILDAIEDFLINKEKSIFIGDKFSDFQASREAKIGKFFFVIKNSLTYIINYFNKL